MDTFLPRKFQENLVMKRMDQFESNLRKMKKKE